jgi:hypothetical protein
MFKIESACSQTPEIPVRAGAARNPEWFWLLMLGL